MTCSSDKLIYISATTEDRSRVSPGVIRSYWPNGIEQAIECYGATAFLSACTNSDYKNKRIGVGKFRNFYQGSSNWTNADFKPGDQGEC
ncbi:hypothetical protein MGMO_74c00080 [Methyloglobulus morosus KoM1]|uniref:Uncharacterized protein n=1 Tax=Methyloglobulus morosus KoM1 TaxID=1116472 RepID=V5DXL5_9GAMM|nr:hypothetical protein [Methyloglobulus morosus]ESS72056.1 hypothetical protein MGMO_74c00080 [Methyloglobulus morosus KoM1]